MEEINQSIIEKYLAHELSPSEERAVEERAAQDPSFNMELKDYQLALTAIKLAERDDLKSRFRERDRILDRKDTPRSSWRGRSIVLLSIILLLGIMLTWTLMRRNPSESIAPTTNFQDSLQQVQPGQGNLDTTSTIPAETVIEKPAKQDPKKQKQAKQGKEIFAMNFEHYRDEFIEPNVRADEESMSPTEKFLFHYAERNFVEAVKDFEQLNPSLQKNPNLQFLQAVSLMAVDRSEEAAILLDDVIRDGKSRYVSEAHYYQALNLVKKEKFSDAISYLKKYLQQPDIRFKEKATLILADLQQ